MSQPHSKSPRCKPVASSERSITLTVQGFSCCGPDGMAREVLWDEVHEIAAWKEDLFAYDVICMGFRAGGTDAECIQVDEEQPGFVELASTVRKRFPAISENWYNDIMTPAFERKFTVLFSRTASSAGARRD